MYLRATTVIAAVLATASTACQSARPLSPADQAAIRAADSIYHAAITAGDVDGATAFFASDATVLPANAPAIHGSGAIRQMWTGVFGTMSIKIAVKSELVAGQGNVGYNIGSYHLSASLKDGSKTPVPEEDGKYLQVFLRQPDGSWKAVADAWNANAAPAPPSAPSAPARRRR